ncbi:NlpC/P60 family protein [Clostridium tertium]|uniref:NlpC/P60 family protein n=1 Tax=Clostridium tertium TaxID=1559 RepID=A0A9X3XKS1_9CLOT|nr:NlpC/P60 family protein [Clostridium tertium]MDC4241185.1 NlpC/P60 family protein [Clostridium tertium]
MIKKKLTKLFSVAVLTSVFLVGFSQMEEAKAYNAGGDGMVKFNSWDINNFNSTKDLWTQYRNQYDPERAKDRIVSGDFDGNGKDEVAAFYDYGNNNAQIHRLYENGGQYNYDSAWKSQEGNFYAPSITGRVVAGDFNGDGKDEIMALYYHYDTTATMFQFSLDNSTQKFSMKSVWKATGVDANHMASMVAGDFDGDGKDEILLFYDYENGVTGMFEIKTGSDGKFTSRKAWENRDFDATRIRNKTVAGDFNGDGKDEVAMFYGYGDFTTKIWSLNNENNNYVLREGWYSSDFGASRISGKVVATHNKNGAKDKIIALYDYGNNETGAFTWELQSNNKFSSARQKVLSNYEADRVTGRVAVGKFDGQTTRLAVMYDGTVVQSQTQADKVIAEARAHIPLVTYVYGADDAARHIFDCSSFTKHIFAHQGISLGRTTWNQMDQGVVVSQANLRAGDLVFTLGGNHVGIYTSNGKMIHNSREGVNVIESNITDFYTARRIL